MVESMRESQDEPLGNVWRLPRRNFLRFAAAGTLGLMVRGVDAEDVSSASDAPLLVPLDKKLSPQWVQSLYERGTPRIHRGDELRFIGMPVGGLTCGQLYLGGDGTLWHWDIFNQYIHTAGEHYANPMIPSSPLEQGFSLTITAPKPQPGRSLDGKGFSEVSFVGHYPIGTVNYRDDRSPLAITLEAFSPFIPLNADDSGIPATILQFTLVNVSDQPIEAELVGHLQNAVALYSGSSQSGVRENEIIRDGNRLLRLNCSAKEQMPQADTPPRPVIVFADFEGPDYGNWTVEGTAFGAGPAHGAPGPEQHLSGFLGNGLVNSWQNSDQPQGKLTSPPFKIERRFINFLIGGGRHPNETCINLLVDGHVVRSETGQDSDAMHWASWNVHDLERRSAQIEIVDRRSGGWGHINLDQIEFADAARHGDVPFAKAADFGTMTLALFEPADADRGAASLSIEGGFIKEDAEHSKPLDEKLIGALFRKISLKPGAATTVNFILAWHFPNLIMPGVKGGVGRFYATRFDSAGDVAAYVASNFERLSNQTRLWRDTWLDSTLPHWLLDRTHLNISTLATSTAYRFANGRFYGWEGVGSCAGTCTHVWGYEQAVGRLFPELDKLLREWADFNPGIGMNADGMIDHRGEFHAGQAVDGQANIIMRAYRDHQMSADRAFLERNYDSIKKAMRWLIAQDALDADTDGILQGPQHNTLDAEWYGPVAWLSGLYLASLLAAEQMALEMNDREFAGECRRIFSIGQQKFVATLFNGEYFIDLPDPRHLDSINSGTGCEIDQVFGQSWAFQVGLERVLPEAPTHSALNALWKYNFTPDVGPYRQVNRPGRWFAMPGEAGLLMCTFPRTDWNYEKARGKGPEWAAGYFNECMNGFEHQVAGHMIWEGLVEKGLSVERAIHDRYDASRRNPWNEAECGDHYARSMASYGVFIAACGYRYHGPRGFLSFDPHLTPENFKAAFTTAQGWGTFAQQTTTTTHDAQLQLKWGELRLTTLALKWSAPVRPKTVAVAIDGQAAAANLTTINGFVHISLVVPASLKSNQRLEVRLT